MVSISGLWLPVPYNIKNILAVLIFMLYQETERIHYIALWAHLRYTWLIPIRLVRWCGNFIGKPYFKLPFCWYRRSNIPYCPFSEFRQDGTAGIRVDRPDREIWDFDWPRTTNNWKNLGNEFIKESADGALLCYDKALSCDAPINGETSKGTSLSVFFSFCDIWGTERVYMVCSEIDSFCSLLGWCCNNLQTADIGWPTGNGKKLSNCQACCLAQLWLGAA